MPPREVRFGIQLDATTSRTTWQAAAAVVHIAGSGEPDLAIVARFDPGRSRAELIALPGTLHGSVAQIVEELHRCREEYGITSFVIGDTGRNRESLAAVMSRP